MLETFFVYDLMLFFSTMFVVASSLIKNNKNFFLVLSILPLFLVSSLRDGVGADYENYVYIYNNLDYYHENWPLETGFYFLNKLYKSFGIHHQFIFVTISAIECLFLYLCLKKLKYSKYSSLFLISYIFIFYLNSLNAIRQSLAMVIVLFGFLILFENKYIKFILMVFFASLFHNIALLFLPFILLGFVSFSRLVIFSIVPVCYFILNFDIINMFTSSNILLETKYNGYLEIVEYARESNLGSGIGIIFQYFILILFFFYRKISFNKDKYNFVIVLSALTLLSLAISIKFYIFHRILSAFSISLVLSIVLLTESKIKSKKLILMVCFVFWGVLFHKDILDSNKELGVGNNKQISPYISIFNTNLK